MAGGWLLTDANEEGFEPFSIRLVITNGVERGLIVVCSDELVSPGLALARILNGPIRCPVRESELQHRSQLIRMVSHQPTDSDDKIGTLIEMKRRAMMINSQTFSDRGPVSSQHPDEPEASILKASAPHPALWDWFCRLGAVNNHPTTKTRIRSRAFQPWAESFGQRVVCDLLELGVGTEEPVTLCG
jgi:hypothetical protein